MASPFSFHCMICFEEFDIETRYPVVLPCGHTYVCNECAQRLDRCMECRTSLVQLIPRGTSDAKGGPGGRWNPQRNNAGRQGNSLPPVKKRLPLPKNVVLMSLIEATELAAENVRRQDDQPSLTESPSLNMPSSVLDPEEDEEQKIKTGTSLAISDCGTYAVAAKGGLEIYPSRPESAFQSGHEQSEEEVDSLVRFFHLDHKLDGGVETEAISQPAGTDAPPGKLSLGDRVQIVSTEAGWAKLARGYGYIRAGNHDLVKVGSSVDRACKLEAILRQLSTRRRQLRQEQKKVDNHFIKLINELQASLMSDDDLTVIAADTFHGKSTEFSEDLSMDKFDSRDNESSGHLTLQEMQSSEREDSTPLKPKPRPMERSVTPPGTTEMTRGFFCAGSDVFESMIGGSRAPPALPSTSAKPAIAQPICKQTSQTPPESTPTTTRLVASVANPSPRALSAGARAWREMHGRAASANLGIDFRTGMSGHSALTSSSAHPHDYLEPRAGTIFRGMSNHTGLTMWKSGQRHLASLAQSLAIPTFMGAGNGEEGVTDSPNLGSAQEH